jgi:mannose/fructose-specific phosphotransferase system component IIA
MIRALVITHGNIGAELVRVTGLILGPVEGLSALSNSGKSLADLRAAITAWLAEGTADGATGAVILVDDYGGSCATAAQLACGQVPDRAIISGVNLAMLLGFLTWRENDEFAELIGRLVRKGREAITLVGGR